MKLFHEPQFSLVDIQGEHEFICGSGETIPIDWVDDYPDCEDGSDESDKGQSNVSSVAVGKRFLGVGLMDMMTATMVRMETFKGGDDSGPNFIGSQLSTAIA